MRRQIALGCLLGVLLAFLLPWTAAAGSYDDMYLLGVNDSVKLNFISSSLMPVRRDGSIYAPCTLLDDSDLELAYAVNRAGGTFTVFNREKTIIFQLSRSGAVDKAGNSYNQRVITRDGVVFFPLRFVAEFFGLRYSFFNVVLPDGTVPIARVTTGRSSLSDTQFGSSAAALAAAPLRQYADKQAAAAATPAPTAAPAATPAPSTDPSAAPEAEPVDVSFAVVCGDGGGFQSLLSTFASARCSAIFFFSPEDLLTRDADVRSAAAAGHQIGLILSADAAQADFQTGNRRLAHILRQETGLVTFSGGSAQDGSWRRWAGNVAPRGRNASAQAKNLLDDIGDVRGGAARVTLNDTQTTAQALSRDMATLAQKPYTLLPVSDAG